MKFAFMQPNGIAAILIAAPKWEVERDLGLTPQPLPDGTIFPTGLSDDDYRAKVMEGIPPDATNVHELPDDWVAPAENRMIRNAWVTDGTEVYIDMAKAKDLTRQAVSRAGNDSELLKRTVDAKTVSDLVDVLKIIST